MGRNITTKSIVFAVVVGMAVLCANPMTARADDFVWNDGGSDGDWSNAANWTPSGPGPQTYPGEINPDADTATFPTPTAPTLTNIPANRIVSVTISDPGATPTLGVDLSTSILTITAGSLSVGASILTVSADVSGAGTLDGGTGTVNVTGNLTIDNYTATTGTTSVGGDFNVATFNPLGGTVSFTGGGAQNVTLNGASFADLDVAKTGGSLTFADVVSVTGALTTAGNAYTVAFNANATFTNVAMATFSNTSSVALGNGAGDTLTFNGGITHITGTTAIAGDVVTSADLVNLAAIQLGANSSITTSGGNVQITTVDNAFSLTVDASGGTVAFGGAVGGTSLSLFQFRQVPARRMPSPFETSRRQDRKPIPAMSLLAPIPR
ncbi:MAG: hypothetical protein HC888_17705 [Candidatus Competibacteraceae bacterium]|nr:hypothetical protein [Candidatus Competibacteraceae bacterium]